MLSVYHTHTPVNQGELSRFLGLLSNLPIMREIDVSARTLKWRSPSQTSRQRKIDIKGVQSGLMLEFGGEKIQEILLNFPEEVRHLIPRFIAECFVALPENNIMVNLKKLHIIRDRSVSLGQVEEWLPAHLGFAKHKQAEERTDGTDERNEKGKHMDEHMVETQELGVKEFEASPEPEGLPIEITPHRYRRPGNSRSLTWTGLRLFCLNPDEAIAHLSEKETEVLSRITVEEVEGGWRVPKLTIVLQLHPDIRLSASAANNFLTAAKNRGLIRREEGQRVWTIRDREWDEVVQPEPSGERQEAEAERKIVEENTVPSSLSVLDQLLRTLEQGGSFRTVLSELFPPEENYTTEEMAALLESEKTRAINLQNRIERAMKALEIHMDYLLSLAEIENE